MLEWQMSNYDRDHVACKAKNIYYVVICWKHLPTTNLDNIKFVGLGDKNSRKFCFAFASSYMDVLKECGNLERGPFIHLPAMSSTCGLSKAGITSEENDELEKPDRGPALQAPN